MPNFDCVMFLPWHCKLQVDFKERYCLRTPEVGRGQMESGPLPLVKLGQNKHGNQMPYLLINDKDFRPLTTIIDWAYMSKATKGLSTRVLTTFSEVQIFHKNPSLNAVLAQGMGLRDYGEFCYSLWFETRTQRNSISNWNVQDTLPHDYCRKSSIFF